MKTVKHTLIVVVTLAVIGFVGYVVYLNATASDRAAEAAQAWNTLKNKSQLENDELRLKNDLLRQQIRGIR